MKQGILIASLLALGAWTTPLAARERPPLTQADYGAEVRHEDGVKIGEAFIKADLLDPYSAAFEWPNSFVAFDEKVPLFKRTTGYATCFTYNAKNSYGGYTGVRTYRIIIRDNKVIDYAQVSELRFVPDICKELTNKYGVTPVTGAPHPAPPLPSARGS